MKKKMSHLCVLLSFRFFTSTKLEADSKLEIKTAAPDAR